MKKITVTQSEYLQVTEKDNINTSDMNGGSGEKGNEEEVNGSQELTEQEIEEFIRKEQQAASEGNNADIDSKYTPQIGMEFKDRNAAHHFFSFYGFLAGFEVVVSHVARTSAKKKNNEIYKQEMKCHRYGKQTKKEVQTEVADETLLCEASNDDKAKRKTNVQI